MLNTLTPPLFASTDTSNFTAYLEQEGYVVIRDILDDLTIKKALELFWKDWLHVTPNFRINLSETYPLIFGKGIAAFNGFGQSDFCWYLRLQNTIIDIFASLHKTRDLMVSFDGFSCFFSQNQQSKLWWHIDQHPDNPIYCIQGAYNFYEVKENDAGFVIIPRSHKTFRPSPLKINPDQDWYKLSDEDDIKKQNQGVKLLIPSNCFVLWNSRLVHSNVGMLINNKKNPNSYKKSILNPNRLTVFITYLPATEDSIIKDKRQDAYHKAYTTTHWTNRVERHRYPRRFEGKYVKKGFNDIKPRLDENGLIPIERLRYIGGSLCKPLLLATGNVPLAKKP